MRGIVVAVGLVACGDAPATAPDAAGDAAPADAGATCLPSATIPLAIDHGAFPATTDHPNVLVYVPARFALDAAAPIDLVVYIHGFSNCVTNVLGDTDTACTTGGAARSSYGLATQFEAADRNAILILPEVAYDQAAGDPGALGTTDGFHALLVDTLAHLPPPLGPLDPSRIGRVVVASHSGGYVAVSAMATIGNVPTRELWLFDSLYGEEARFDAYVQDDLASFVAPDRRFAIVYTDGGGTLANSQAMADRAATWTAGEPAVLVDDRTTSTWTDDIYRHGLLFKHSALSHDGVPRYYVEHMLATSGSLAARTCAP